MKIFVIFGKNQVHKINNKIIDKDCLVMIKCDNYKEGKKKIYKLFGNNYCFDYYFDNYDDNDFKYNYLKYFPKGIIEL